MFFNIQIIKTLKITNPMPSKKWSLLQSGIFVLLAFFMSTAMAEVYQYIDEEGNVVFTDKPVEGAIERKVKEPPVIDFKLPEKPKVEEKQTESKSTKKEPEAKPYTKFSITSPQEEEKVRHDAGVLVIKAQIEPPLQTNFGHKVKLQFDDEWQDKTYTSSTIRLENVFRGTHYIKLAIVDQTGKRIKTTSKVKFYMLRFSRHFR